MKAENMEFAFCDASLRYIIIYEHSPVHFDNVPNKEEYFNPGKPEEFIYHYRQLSFGV